MNNLVEDSAYESIRKELLNKHLEKLLSHLDLEKFRNIDYTRWYKQIKKEFEENLQ